MLIIFIGMNICQTNSYLFHRDIITSDHIHKYCQYKYQVKTETLSFVLLPLCLVNHNCFILHVEIYKPVSFVCNSTAKASAVDNMPIWRPSFIHVLFDLLDDGGIIAVRRRLFFQYLDCCDDRILL